MLIPTICCVSKCMNMLSRMHDVKIENNSNHSNDENECCCYGDGGDDGSHWYVSQMRAKKVCIVF